jgi:hypothetical protein
VERSVWHCFGLIVSQTPFAARIIGQGNKITSLFERLLPSKFARAKMNVTGRAHHLQITIKNHLSQESFTVILVLKNDLPAVL